MGFGSRAGHTMKPGGKLPMDYFVVDFVEAGRALGRQMFFCESSMDKAEEIAKAWKISQNVLGEPDISNNVGPVKLFLRELLRSLLGALVCDTLLTSALRTTARL